MSIQPLSIHPIGTVRSSRTEPVDDDWDAVDCSIELDAAHYDASALAGLDAFSHIDVVYIFDRVDPAKVERSSRHPRGNTDWPEVGIFAQRAKNRPNRIGVCTCVLLRVDGLTLSVRGLDAVDGTPVVDIKPYLVEFGPRGPVRQPAWSTELMAGYW